jgi:hypothetical protein
MVVYPLEFYRHSERRWKHRFKASTRSQHDDASTNRGNESKLLPRRRKTIGVQAPSRLRT